MKGVGRGESSGTELLSAEVLKSTRPAAGERRAGVADRGQQKGGVADRCGGCGQQKGGVAVGVGSKRSGVAYRWRLA
jgi:hypothetical protein